MAQRPSQAKQTDSKGRLTLGEAFANRTVLVEHSGDEIVIRLARVIPEREAWLYDTPAALEAVRLGLSQARQGMLVDGPDLKLAEKRARQLKGE